MLNTITFYRPVVILTGLHQFPSIDIYTVSVNMIACVFQNNVMGTVFSIFNDKTIRHGWIGD